MNKDIIIIEDDLDISYNANISDKKIKMNFSKSSIWDSSVRGLPIGELKDNGNNIRIQMGDLNLKLDYDNFVELYLLMKMKMKFDEKLSNGFQILTKK